jgi:predicted membrane protein
VLFNGTVNVKIYYIILYCYVILYYVMLCYACYAMLCYVMLCYVMLAMLCYVILYYIILYYIINGVGQREELQEPHFKRQLRQEPCIKNKIFVPFLMTFCPINSNM